MLKNQFVPPPVKEQPVVRCGYCNQRITESIRNIIWVRVIMTGHRAFVCKAKGKL